MKRSIVRVGRLGMLFLCLSALLLLQSGPINAQQTVPATLTYQGTLRDAEGNLVNGSRDMTFRIYAAVVGGSPLFTETISGVNVVDGIFNVVLGDASGNALPGSIFKTDKRYLGITVGQGTELAPRQRLHPVPWAQQASHAFNASASDSLNANAQVGKISGAVDIDGSLTTNGSITGNTLAGSSVEAPTIIGQSLLETKGDLIVDTFAFFKDADNRSNEPWVLFAGQSAGNQKQRFHIAYDAPSGREYPVILRRDLNNNTATYSFDVEGRVLASAGFNGRCVQSFSSGGGVCDQDVAETFATDQLTEPGELVVLLPEDRDVAAVTLSRHSYDSGLIGIVSTKPGLVFDQGETLLAGETGNLITEEKTVVAMIGRVPAKFSLENGPIAVGDPLTSASEPGLAMRASKAGQIVGYAMQSSDEAVDGKILVWLQPGLYIPESHMDALNALVAGDGKMDTSAPLSSLPMLPLMGGLLLTGAAAGLLSRRRGR